MKWKHYEIIKNIVWNLSCCEKRHKSYNIELIVTYNILKVIIFSTGCSFSMSMNFSANGFSVFTLFLEHILEIVNHLL